MKEDFLHFLWKFRKFDFINLQTIEGEKVELIDPGEHNLEAGPDFSAAKIKIGNTLWVGNVEIHIKASDWNRHRHQFDLAYNTVILHVVYVNDQEIRTASGLIIPTIELKNRINEDIWNRYQSLAENLALIPCHHFIHQVPKIKKNSWLARMIVERLESKTNHLEEVWEWNARSWEPTFYQMMGHGFGMRSNRVAFEMLARALPLSIVLKHRDDLFQLEALFFGQAGMLDRAFIDTYPQQLKKEYIFLRKKYNLKPIKASAWKFLRMRPASFPTIRIAQFARLWFQRPYLFREVIENESIEWYYQTFKIKSSSYWENHYVFDKKSNAKSKYIGKGTINLILINILAPMLFLYGQKIGNDLFVDRAIRLLEQLPAEKNSLITKWNSLGWEVETAAESQGLIHLKNEYCTNKKCTNCAIGNSILKGE